MSILAVQRLLELFIVILDAIANVLRDAAGAFVKDGAQNGHVGDGIDSILNGGSDGVLGLRLELGIDNCLLLHRLFDLLDDIIDLLPECLLRCKLALLLVVEDHVRIGRQLVLELLNVVEFLVLVSNSLAKSHLVRVAVGSILGEESRLDEGLLALKLFHCVSWCGLAKES